MPRPADQENAGGFGGRKVIMRQAFARRLRNILIRERLNPADVARRLGRGHADVVAVSNWLSGRNEPNMRNLLRLSTALRTDPAAAKTERESPDLCRFVPILMGIWPVCRLAPFTEPSITCINVSFG